MVADAVARPSEEEWKYLYRNSIGFKKWTEVNNIGEPEP